MKGGFGAYFVLRVQMCAQLVTHMNCNDEVNLQVFLQRLVTKTNSITVNKHQETFNYRSMHSKVI